MSYARSFVDAPCWYRYNVFPSYQGSENLRPEHLQSVQVTPTISLFDGQFRNTVNVFYNAASNFVFRDNNAGPADPEYINAGTLRNAGIETETGWLREAVHVRGVVTFQQVLESRNFNARAGEIFNIPRFHGNLLVDVNPVRRLSKDTWVNVTLQYGSSQLSPIGRTFRLNGDNVVVPFQDPDNRVKARLLVNTGLRLPHVLGSSASLALNVFNLFDARYEQGAASSIRPPRLAGPWS